MPTQSIDDRKKEFYKTVLGYTDTQMASKSLKDLEKEFFEQGGYTDMTNIAAPSAPASGKARMYARDNGSGKGQIVVRFPTGAVQVLATEP